MSNCTCLENACDYVYGCGKSNEGMPFNLSFLFNLWGQISYFFNLYLFDQIYDRFVSFNQLRYNTADLTIQNLCQFVVYKYFFCNRNCCYITFIATKENNLLFFLLWNHLITYQRLIRTQFFFFYDHRVIKKEQLFIII